jgi:hypothetical protein
MVATRDLMGSSATRFGEQRRSHRVHIAINIIVRGKRGEHPFEEQTSTTVVNSAGGLMLTDLSLQQGQMITITHKTTAEEAAAKVVFLGVGEGNRAQVGFEFMEPSPKFWRISFPPDNWDANDRKRPLEPPKLTTEKPKSDKMTVLPSGRK